jgi:cyclase
MLKKRIIFSLLYKDGKFCLSRNFRLQEIGDIEWLLNSFNFEKLSGSIDELVILNLSTSNTLSKSFLLDISRITQNFFVPITIGGKIRTLKEASQYFSCGADKISLNFLYLENESIALEIAEKYGSQAVIASIDYKKIRESEIPSYKAYEYGRKNAFKDLSEHIIAVQKFGCGELLLRSVDNDGTGNGLDLKMLDVLPSGILNVPLILAGGIGKSEHMLDGLLHPKIDAICTANLLNFIDLGFIKARQQLELSNLPISKITLQ